MMAVQLANPTSCITQKVYGEPMILRVSIALASESSKGSLALSVQYVDTFRSFAQLKCFH
jgi:hypothetical protein